MSAERLELSTNGLKGHCSTIELRARKECYFNTPLAGRQRVDIIELPVNDKAVIQPKNYPTDLIPPSG